jgi:hypothetical protein
VVLYYMLPIRSMKLPKACFSGEALRAGSKCIFRP